MDFIVRLVQRRREGIQFKGRWGTQTAISFVFSDQSAGKTAESAVDCLSL